MQLKQNQAAERIEDNAAEDLQYNRKYSAVQNGCKQANDSKHAGAEYEIWNRTQIGTAKYDHAAHFPILPEKTYAFCDQGPEHCSKCTIPANQKIIAKDIHKRGQKHGLNENRFKLVRDKLIHPGEHREAFDQDDRREYLNQNDAGLKAAAEEKRRKIR